MSAVGQSRLDIGTGRTGYFGAIRGSHPGSGRPVNIIRFCIILSRPGNRYLAIPRRSSNPRWRRYLSITATSYNYYNYRKEADN